MIALLCLLFVSFLPFMPFFYSHLNTFMDSSGDGLKNYFGYLWYIREEPLGIWSSGLNYPFGDNLVFTDNQPFLAITVKFLSGIFRLDFQEQIFILHSALFLSWALAPMFMYLIFRHFRFPNPWAALWAILVVWMSPQVFRTTGHFGLAYGIYIPVLWLLSLKLENRRLLKSVLSVAWVSLFAGLHLYNLMLALILWTGESIGIILKLGWRGGYKRVVPKAIQSVAVLLIAFSWAKGTDPVTDRYVPEGGFFYRSYFESVFIPPEYTHSPVREFFKLFGKMRDNITIEAYGYVGIVSLPFLVLLLVLLVQHIRAKTWRATWEILKESEWFVPMVAGVIALLFSWGLPFRWFSEKSLASFGLLSHFRSMGRFVWVFYFVWMAFLPIFILKRLEQKKVKPILLQAALSVVFLIYVAEAYVFPAQYFLHFWRLGPANALVWQSGNLDPLGGIFRDFDSSKYQAILPLPHFQVGGPELYKRSDNETFDQSLVDTLRASWNVRLPILANYLSRSSLKQTQAMRGIFDSQYDPALLLAKLDPTKPILILRGVEPLRPEEKDLLQRSTKLIENEKYALYEISVQNLVAH